MRISIITLFPEMFSGVFDSSIVKRAVQRGKLEIHLINLRDFALDAYGSVDDHPYGGGTGMVLKVDVMDRAIQSARSGSEKGKTERVILLTPQGTPYVQKKARTLCRYTHLILLCGHYEGVDERIRSLVDEEISIGDYILTGGEIPAMVLTDSVARLLPGVLIKEDATVKESFESGILEYPHYTRPEVYRDQRVPAILLSGNHAKIETWKAKEAITRTKKRRPDLLRVQKGRLSRGR